MAQLCLSSPACCVTKPSQRWQPVPVLLESLLLKSWQPAVHCMEQLSMSAGILCRWQDDYTQHTLGSVFLSVPQEAPPDNLVWMTGAVPCCAMCCAMCCVMCCAFRSTCCVQTCWGVSMTLARGTASHPTALLLLLEGPGAGGPSTQGSTPPLLLSSIGC